MGSYSHGGGDKRKYYFAFRHSASLGMVPKGGSSIRRDIVKTFGRTGSGQIEDKIESVTFDKWGYGLRK